MTLSPLTKLASLATSQAGRNRHGGGVCVFIPEDLAFIRRQDLEADNIESIWPEMTLTRTKPIIAGIGYRLPKQSHIL